MPVGLLLLDPPSVCTLCAPRQEKGAGIMADPSGYGKKVMAWDGLPRLAQLFVVVQSHSRAAAQHTSLPACRICAVLPPLPCREARRAPATEAAQPALVPLTHKQVQPRF